MGGNIRFMFKVIGALENAELIRQKNESCKNCELLRAKKCEKNQLCLKILSETLKDHPSNISRKLNALTEYFQQIPEADIIQIIRKKAPRGRPRKVIVLSENWTYKMERITSRLSKSG